MRIPGGGTTLGSWDMPERGDIVVFRYPSDQKVDYIKRIIGLPGDSIELRRNELFVNGQQYARQFARTMTYTDQQCRTERGRVFVEDNGSKQYEVVLRDGPDAFENFGPITVKPGHLFAMGDNRDNSSDSRAWGQVPAEYVKGRALFVWLSVDPCRSWLGKVRLRRFGHKVE
jgi:signal peptidase I